MHLHCLQYFFCTTPPDTVLGQQSPPSYAQPLLLLSSSQLPSPLYLGAPHVASASARLSGSKHLHCEQWSFSTVPPDTVLGQQSPPSQSHPLLLFSSSQRVSPLYCSNPHVAGGSPRLSGS